MLEQDALRLIRQYTIDHNEMPVTLHGTWDDLIGAMEWECTACDMDGLYMMLPFGNVYLELDDEVRIG